MEDHKRPSVKELVDKGYLIRPEVSPCTSKFVLRILSGDEEYEKVRAERNNAREEYEKTGNRGALALVKSLDKVLETYEQSRSIKAPQND